MKAKLKQLGQVVGLVTLASGLSACSLLGKNRASAQWEIESDVPASLNSGRATTPGPESVASSRVKSDLDGQPLAADTPLELPASTDRMMANIPKPSSLHGQTTEQAPPEMLSIPPTEGAGDLPDGTGPTLGMNTLLTGPPPEVTEEELTMPLTDELMAETAEVPAEVAAAPAPIPTPAVEIPSLTPAEPATSPPPSIPLLYGKLDLAAFLTPPAPLAANTPVQPATP